MLERQNREPIEWEDTLSQSELAYAEKLQAENNTIQVFKKAQEDDNISGYLHALSFQSVPREFTKVKREFQLRLQELIIRDADLKHLKARSYDSQSIIRMHLEFRNQDLVRIYTKEKEVHINGKDWTTEFSQYLNEEIFAWREEWLAYKKKQLESRVAKNDDNRPDELSDIAEEERVLKKERREWDDDHFFPPEEEILKDVDQLLQLMEREGYSIHIDGLSEKNAHYMLKSRYRWEEDYSDQLSKLQRKFARPVNQPTSDERNTHFSSGMVERSIGSLFVLTTPSNEFTLDFYERRFSEKEWVQLHNIPKLTNFDIQAGYRDIIMKYNPTGTIYTIYPNGHILVEVPKDANHDLLATRVPLLPFLWHPAIKDFLKEMGDRMRHY